MQNSGSSIANQARRRTDETGQKHGDQEYFSAPYFCQNLWPSAFVIFCVLLRPIHLWLRLRRAGCVAPFSGQSIFPPQSHLITPDHSKKIMSLMNSAGPGEVSDEASALTPPSPPRRG